MNRKILMLVCCLVAVLLLGTSPMTAQDIPGITIADLLATAARSPERAFTLFSAMILDADPSVLDALDNPNNRLTVFVPTDRAIEELRQSRFGAAAYFVFGQDREMVTRTLLYHIAPGEFDTADIKANIGEDIANGWNLPTMTGQLLHFTASADSSDYVIDGEARPVVQGTAITIAGENTSLTIAGPDIQAVNGIIHVIDHVLVPTVDSVVRVLQDNTFAPSESFNSFLHAVAIADPSVSEQLIDPTSEITVLVPTDAAFEAFETPIETMLANVEETSNVIAYHILPGRFTSYDIRGWIAGSSDGTAVINTSLGGLFSRTAVAFTLDEERDLVANGGAHLIYRDIDAGRSLIHVIDAVLQPPA